MNKSQFIEMVADKAEMSKAAASRVVDAIFNTASGAITEAVSAAGHLSIPGFGKFSRKTRAARTGRNPRTGAAIDIPERTTMGFTPGRGLREMGATGGDGRSGGVAGVRKTTTTVRKTAGATKRTAGTAAKAAGARKSAGRAAEGGTRAGTSRTAAKSGGTATAKKSGAAKSGGSAAAKRSTARKSS